MIHTGFARPQDSHQHSLQTLSMLYNHIDFMESIGTLADMGCGTGLDLEWWATRTTQEDNPKPLNIRCVGIDCTPQLSLSQKYRNISFTHQDFEQPIKQKNKFDVLWCHDSFQYVIDPFTTLRQWNEATHENGMLVLILPQTTNMEFNDQEFDQPDYCYYNWTMVSLMHVLAVNGWDCGSGFFKKAPGDHWLHAVVYKSTHPPMDPRTTRWYQLAEMGLLPDSAKQSILKYGYLRQRDLVVPWLDHSLSWLGQQ